MKLYGLSLTQHLDALFSEVEALGSLYGFPLSAAWSCVDGVDLSVTFQGKPAATPLGPASGPHTQMAQNIVLSFLGGCRIMELKTVQILDELDIPRPCIDARTIGFNVEWSQELKLHESYHEYVTAWILLAIIEELEWLGKPKGHPFYAKIFDLSVGYDLAGIRSDAITGWIRSMCNASEAISAQLAALPDRYARFRSLAVSPHIASSLTLSTFHGCPHHEIEGIVTYLIGELGLDVYVKMNPTQLGLARVDQLLRGELGYAHLELDPHAFESDLQFTDGVAMMQRLVAFAHERGRRCGAKFTNTLVVKNNDTFFKDPVMYLSGPPLHVLSMNAMLQFRNAMGPDFPASFSAGIDQANFVEAIACGLVPVTTCTDLLQKGGYTRAVKYLRQLEKALVQAGVNNLAAFLASQNPHGTPSGLDFANRHVPTLASQTKYHYSQNSKPPKKVESQLSTYDCLTCNICLPVCPNGANFSLPIGTRQIDYDQVHIHQGQAETAARATLNLTKKAQIANFADWCNECANCEVFCPEHGGPQRAKARFFTSAQSFDEAPDHHGFYFKDAFTLVGRSEGVVVQLQSLPTQNSWSYQHPDVGTLLFDDDNRLVKAVLKADLTHLGQVDTQTYMTMRTFFEALRDSPDYPARFLRANSAS